MNIKPEDEILLPQYANPKSRSDAGRWNDAAYARTRQSFQEALSRYDLPTAFAMMHAQQMDVGFIQDDLSQVLCFQSYCPSDDSRYLLGQFNPRRADRTKGSGRTAPPPGVGTVQTPDLSCYLCTGNVRWQSRGIQMYYEIEINGHPYVAMSNPFPFMPFHTTIASVEHEPQSWHASAAWTGDKLERIVADLYELADRLPNFVSFYNGVGAGASIEKHLHFQAFQLPPGHGLFPLQAAAAQVAFRNRKYISIETSDYEVTAIDSHYYPINAYRITGSREEVIRITVNFLKRWSDLVGISASANIAVIKEDRVTMLYLIPRNKAFSKAAGLTGIVGGLEVLGEFIFCTPEENLLINNQTVNYSYIADVLRGIRPPNIERLSR